MSLSSGYQQQRGQSGQTAAVVCALNHSEKQSVGRQVVFSSESWKYPRTENSSTVSVWKYVCGLVISTSSVPISAAFSKHKHTRTNSCPISGDLRIGTGVVVIFIEGGFRAQEEGVRFTHSQGPVSNSSHLSALPMTVTSTLLTCVAVVYVIRCLIFSRFPQNLFYKKS